MEGQEEGEKERKEDKVLRVIKQRKKGKRAAAMETL